MDHIDGPLGEYCPGCILELMHAKSIWDKACEGLLDDLQAFLYSWDAFLQSYAWPQGGYRHRFLQNMFDAAMKDASEYHKDELHEIANVVSDGNRHLKAWIKKFGDVLDDDLSENVFLKIDISTEG